MILACSPSRHRAFRISTTSLHSDQQNQRLHSPEPQRICITLPRHPLFGQSLAVIREMYGDGGHRLVVELPDGHTQLIPAWWTDREDVAEQSPFSVALRLTPASLRSLVRMVAHINEQRQPEAYDDSRSAALCLDHLQPRDASTPDVSMDRSAAPSAPSPSAVSERTVR